MTELSSLDAARFAFRPRGERFVLTKAAVAYVLLNAIVGGVALAAAWPSVNALAAWYFDAIGAITSGGEPSLPPQELIMAIAPAGAAAGAIGLVLLAAFEAACLRWLVRGERGGGLFGLSLCADTWRVFGLYWVWFGLFVVMICGVILFYAALRALSGLHPALQFIAIIVGVLAPLALFALVIFLSVRLSPAAAYSVGRRKFSFFGVWPVTRGKFWPLLGAFVIAFVAYLVVQTVVGGVLGIPLHQAMQSTMFQVMAGASGAAAWEGLRATMLTPSNIALLVIYTVALRIIALMFVVAWYGVNASVVGEERAPPP